MRIWFHLLSFDSVEPSYSSESAATLETESGYVMETSRVAEFRRCILDGTWREAEEALEHLGVAEDDGLWVWFNYAQLNESCVLIHRICQEAKFLISQQKYLEFLETGKTAMALHVLRNELAPLHMDPEQLQPLSRSAALTLLGTRVV